MIKYIYLRNSLDWSSLKSIQDYIEANIYSRQLIKDWMPHIINSIEQWNCHFNINYFEFRAKMKEIMLFNISKIEDVVVIDKNKKQVLSNSENFILYPIDDDDWASPEIFDCAKKNMDIEDDVIVWPFGFFRHYSMITDIDKPIDNIKYVYSNNCILTKKGYEKFCKICDYCDFLEDHRECDKYSQYSDCVVKIIRKPLSVYNHSPASATKLWSFSKFESFSNSIFHLISDYNKPSGIPSELDWSRPYAKRFWNLIFKLKKGKLFL